MAARGEPVKVTGRAALEKLTPAQQEARRRALNVVNLMRTQGMTLKTAAAREGTTPATVRRYASAAHIKEGRRYAATRTDRLYTRMAVLSTTGLVDVAVRGSKVRTLIALHWNAVQQFAFTGDESKLAPFAGKRAGGVELATSPAKVEEFWRQGDLDVDDIYA